MDLEARKNANSALRDVTAQVFDRGLFHFPARIPYVVMESVDSSHTLGSWIEARDRDWAQAQSAMTKRAARHRDYNDRGRNWEGDRRREVMAESLDLAAGVLHVVIRMHRSEVIHGDLNPGNVLIRNTSSDPDDRTRSLRRGPDSIEKEGDLRGNRYLHPESSRKVPGTIQSVPTRIIDLGTSQLEGTEPRVGVLRETWFLVENLRKIMKPWFSKRTTLTNSWTRLRQNRSDIVPTFRAGDDDVDPRALAGDLLRLVCVANLLLGHTHSMRDPMTDAPSSHLTLDEKDLSDLRELMVGPLRQFNSDLIDGETIAALQTLPPRSESYVRWDHVLGFFETEHPALAPSLASLSDLRS
ncbi:hypothetical protein [Curtobacterium flaccumfaciens]|uniref:hypothetical protein n=1 Tax=Curtobacterium flaccumfaciens TaxID=2035 RepID=UPI00220CC0D0|nr:hypothetical protein [Curtobacterium flaccumfaciens]UWD79173.1 hypothetical protein NY058_17485 [Curtobacterium flaccumfaciens]